MTNPDMPADTAALRAYRRPQLVADGHVPTIAETGHETPAWGVHCYACSSQAEDYVWPCREGVDYEVPTELVALDALTAAHAELAALRAPVEPAYDGEMIDQTATWLTHREHTDGAEAVRNLAAIVDRLTAELARWAPLTDAWMRSENELTAELLKRGEQNTAMAKLNTTLTRELEQARGWEQRALMFEQRATDAERRLHAVRMLKVWTSEDKRQFVFTDDLWAATDPEHNAIPAVPVPAPADEPNLGTLRRLDRDPGPADDECDDGPHAYHREPCPAAPAAVAVELHCRAEYTRPGGRQRGDRSVRCHLPAGHGGEHKEADTEITWLPDAVADTAEPRAAVAVETEPAEPRPWLPSSDIVRGTGPFGDWVYVECEPCKFARTETSYERAELTALQHDEDHNRGATPPEHPVAAPVVVEPADVQQDGGAS